MPTYLYSCPQHLEFEHIQSIKDPPLKECPMCKKDGVISEVKRLIAPSNFVLKGGGWASSGYK